MAHISPDTASRLKPDLLPVVHTLYTQMCNLQPGEKVLVISDARTPFELVAAFQGMAMTLGAEAVVIEASIPYGGPTYQPGASWSSMVAAAALEANLIIDLAVGYAEFISAAMDRGARVLMPGDGIGGPYLDDMLIRNIRDVDIHALRRSAGRIAQRFTEASKISLITGGSDLLEIDISGLRGEPVDGFLWDPDKGEFKSNYEIMPPAQPGVMIPKGRANGTVCVEGVVLWHQVYHECPREDLRLTFENSRLVDLQGDRNLANRVRRWLETLGDDGAWEGPNHFNIGINPNAMLSQNQEWERIYGSVTCGMGDMSTAGKLLSAGSSMEYAASSVHWDWTILQPEILLDDEVLVRGGVVHDAE
ncbi:MAG TPA: hypothetical protein DD491_09605 [Halieaceae bacterium]|nr:hypothetical protein [Halieaceae bacterium]|tara:strand:+ start:1065 stop:2150 length:1086 start_codon:yes stop_codon:yes gene_type:complete